MNHSKPLSNHDASGFEFVKETLDGDPTFAINFDRLQHHPTRGYIIFEFLLCDEKQQNVDPLTSHPKFYWEKNKHKFTSLHRVQKDLKATLYLVNYAKTGTRHADKIKVIKVWDVTEAGITKAEERKMTREEYAYWFRKLNKECSE